MEAAGALAYEIIRPSGVTLDAERSRIQIEQGGAVLSGINGGEFSGGVRRVADSIEDARINLAEGSYTVDILLATPEGKTAEFREEIDIISGETRAISFAPPADDFFNPGAVSAAGKFDTTKYNTSKTKVGSSGGGVLKRTQALSAYHDMAEAFFVFRKGKAGQSLVVGGPDGGKVTKQESGSLDGTNTENNRVLFTVDTSSIGETGGEVEFTLTLRDPEPDKEAIIYAVTLTLPHLVKLEITAYPERWVYVKGDAFDVTGMRLTGTWSDGKTDPVTGGWEIHGFTSEEEGECTVYITKNGVTAYRWSAGGGGVEAAPYPESDKIPVSVRSPALFFDGGLGADYLPLPAVYTVPQGRKVTLAPVKRLIPADAVYEWAVDGAVQGSSTGEYFSYTAGADSGEHTVTVTAKRPDGAVLASAEAAVRCTPAAAARPVTGSSSGVAEKLDSRLAPGQFGTFGTTFHYHGFGGFGGYAIFSFDHSVIKKGVDGEELKIGGNAFGGWQEPGAIWASQDDNGNGLPDDTWYELKGSHTLVPGTERRYAVTFKKDYTWVDNLGNGGTYPTLQHWRDGYYRSLEEVTFCGTRLDKSANNLTGGIWGYADVNDNGRVSLSNAIQADGSPVELEFIDFIKIVSALHKANSVLGECSTEAGTPTDRSLGDPDTEIQGKNLGGGQYEYIIQNDSGYALTVSFAGEEIALPIGAVVTKISTKSSVYYEASGGNVKLNRYAGKGIFVNG
jgi:hypothetical protein